MDCHQHYPYFVMSLHHVRGQKLFELSKTGNSRKFLGREHRSLSEVKAEIEKCDLLCLNCHATRTYRATQHNEEE